MYKAKGKYRDARHPYTRKYRAFLPPINPITTNHIRNLVMTKDSVTDFSILIKAHDDLKTEVSSVRIILDSLLNNNLNSSRSLKHTDKLLSELEKDMDVFFEKVTYFSCSPGN